MLLRAHLSLLMFAVFAAAIAIHPGSQPPLRLQRFAEQVTMPAQLQPRRQGNAADISGSAQLLRLRGGMSVAVGWALLFGATASELVSTGFMHYAQGFKNPIESVLAVLFYGISFLGFNLSLRALEISVAYAVWSAIVMALLAAGGMTFLGESVSLLKIFGIFSIIAGTVCLSLTQEV